MRFDNLIIENLRVCVDVFPPSTSPIYVPPTIVGAPGYACDSQFGHSGHVYNFFRFKYHTSQVWINGIRQVATVNYDENGTGGSITLSHSLTSNDIVYLCAEPL
jgi:hypothetical protein